MTEHRNPEEHATVDEHDARVRAVLDEAVRIGGMLMAAIELKEPQDVVDLWTDRFWNHLRDELSDEDREIPGLRYEDRLVAIVLLLGPRLGAEAGAIVQGMRRGPS